MTSTKKDVLVTLNVGGRCFMTTRSTLTSIHGSMLARMFSGTVTPSRLVDKDGNTFIDRDPHLFDIVLQYLRTREIVYSDKYTDVVVREELRYFGLLPPDKDDHIPAPPRWERAWEDSVWRWLFMQSTNLKRVFADPAKYLAEYKAIKRHRRNLKIAQRPKWSGSLRQKWSGSLLPKNSKELLGYVFLVNVTCVSSLWACCKALYACTLSYTKMSSSTCPCLCLMATRARRSKVYIRNDKSASANSRMPVESCGHDMSQWRRPCAWYRNHV